LILLPDYSVFLFLLSFRHSYVVTKFAKAVAWVCVVLLNFFFVYFSMLRGLQRGLDWQRLFCVACVIQLIAEVLFYETSECAIVNYFIPDLARTEVQGVTYAIHQAIQSMFSSVADAKVPIFDAPRYLFLSTRLAERFPDLLESVIVRSYHSYSPGELSQKWRISHGTTFVSSDNRIGSRARRMTFTGVLVGMLQYLGSVSISTQRFFIHGLQPVIMAGVAAVIGLILSDPWYVLIFVPFLAYGSYLLWDHWRSHDDDDNDGSREDAIMPLPDTTHTKAKAAPISTSSPSSSSNIRPSPPLSAPLHLPPSLHESDDSSSLAPASSRGGGENAASVSYDSPSSEDFTAHFKHSHSYDDDNDSNSCSDGCRDSSESLRRGTSNQKKQFSVSSDEIEVDLKVLFDIESLEVEED
jgi:hypothetical protein